MPSKSTEVLSITSRRHSIFKFCQPLYMYIYSGMHALCFLTYIFQILDFDLSMRGSDAQRPPPPSKLRADLPSSVSIISTIKHPCVRTPCAAPSRVYARSRGPRNRPMFVDYSTVISPAWYYTTPSVCTSSLVHSSQFTALP